MGTSILHIANVNTNMTLYIRPHNDTVRDLLVDQILKHRPTDSGFDIPIRATAIDLNQKQHSFDLEISVAAMDDETTEQPAPCLLLPRSSIYKLPFRLCNSIGLIDSGYRGEVMAKVDILDWRNKVEPEYMRLDEGYRLFQICRSDFSPWKKIIIVEELPTANDNRGVGGFGSTS